MTVRECYEKIGSDFDKVLERMGSEALVKRFAIKFLEDKSFEELTESRRSSLRRLARARCCAPTST